MRLDPTMNPSPDEQIRPELVFGLVGALGSDLDLIERCLRDALEKVSYTTQAIRISTLLDALPHGVELHATPEEERLHSYMTAGNALCAKMGTGDALARAAVSRIWEIRDQQGDRLRPLSATAFVLHSLKRSDEVDLLRRVYGSGFFLIGAYSPLEARIENVATRLAKSHGREESVEFSPTARKLVDRDQFESADQFGQRVRDAFAKADVFVDTRSPVEARQGILRFIEILFRHPNRPPTVDEISMFHAHAAATRSSSLARQVGAAIVSPDGAIIATGMNEVPKAGGGFYDSNDGERDKRDFQLGYDSNARMKADVVQEILECFDRQGWLAECVQAVGRPATYDVEEACRLLKDCRIMNLTEFGREVHAEMAAILDAARRGVPIRGATLYCTTFPCHNCAKHIVSAGVATVYFIEPYPKSLAAELHADSVAVESTSEGKVPFLPFLGIGASRYMDLFSMSTTDGFKILRKDNAGSRVGWTPETCFPRLPMWDTSYTHRETNTLDGFAEKLKTSPAGIIEDENDG